MSTATQSAGFDWDAFWKQFWPMEVSRKANFFDEAMGNDGVVYNERLIFGNGAWRDVNPLGRYEGPDKEPVRHLNILRNRQVAMVDKTVKAFNILQHELLVGDYSQIDLHIRKRMKKELEQLHADAVAMTNHLIEIDKQIYDLPESKAKREREASAALSQAEYQAEQFRLTNDVQALSLESHFTFQRNNDKRLIAVTKIE